MATLAIDTHKTINKLVERGFTPEQAEGVIQALTESELVSRDYLDMKLAEQTASTVKWVAGLLLAQAALIVTLQNLLAS